MPLCNFQYENGFKTAKDILTKFDIYNKYKALSDFVQIIRSVTTFFYRIKGRFLEFRRYHNFANLFSNLSRSTFY